MGHIQLDELVTRVRRWAKRAWVWTAEDVQSKAWLAWHVGGRAQADAHRLVHRVTQVLARECVPVFTSDGLRQYFHALTAHFGEWVEQTGKRKPVWQVDPALLYGQFRKVKAGYKLRKVYTKMLCGERSALAGVLQALGLSGGIQTAYVERLNLTLRHTVAALRRRRCGGGPGHWPTACRRCAGGSRWRRRTTTSAGRIRRCGWRWARVATEGGPRRWRWA